jgi:hypothetical protein
MSSTRKGRRALTLDVFEEALEPLVELLLAAGLTVREAQNVLRDVFVQVADQRIVRESGRRSASLIALQCGLYRSEVRKRLVARGRIPSSNDKPLRDAHRLSRLLTGWHNDPEFLTKQGSPRLLHLQGRNSFSTLVSRYAANLYPIVVLEELERVGAVVRKGKALKVCAREYFAGDVIERRLTEFGSRAKDALRALVSTTQRATAGPLVMSAVGLDVDVRYLPVLRGMLRQRSQAFVTVVGEELNDFSKQARPPEGARIGLMLVGIGDWASEGHTEPSSTVPSGPGRRSGRSRSPSKSVQ